MRISGLVKAEWEITNYDTSTLPTLGIWAWFDVALHNWFFQATAFGDVATISISLTTQVEDAFEQLYCPLLRHVNASLPPLGLIRPLVDVRKASSQSSLLATDIETHGACLWHFSSGVDRAYSTGLASNYGIPRCTFLWNDLISSPDIRVCSSHTNTSLGVTRASVVRKSVSIHRSSSHSPSVPLRCPIVVDWEVQR
jgi:hypothetical protein